MKRLAIYIQEIAARQSAAPFWLQIGFGQKDFPPCEFEVAKNDKNDPTETTIRIVGRDFRVPRNGKNDPSGTLIRIGGRDFRVPRNGKNDPSGTQIRIGSRDFRGPEGGP